MAAASAEPFYGYHQQAWPAAYGPGFSRTCYGCRGKRDADAEPGYGSTLGVHPGHAVSYSNRSPQGAYGFGHYGKRSAEPGYGYGGGYIIQSRGFGGAPGSFGHFNGVHPAGHLNTFAHPVGKRSAEPGYGLGYGGHYGGGVSYTQRSPQGLGAHRGYHWG